jgi:endo-1,4-beta-xylanase
MKLQVIKIIAGVFAITSFSSCEEANLSPETGSTSADANRSARVAAVFVDNYTTKLMNLAPFRIGIETENKVLNLDAGRNPNALVRLKDNFNSLTMRLYFAEMYSTPNTTSWGTISYTNSDNLFNFAKNNSYTRVHGHSLVYHVGMSANQQAYLNSLTGATGTTTFEGHIRTHIQNILNHYKTLGMANRSYDVINEVISDGSTTYRTVAESNLFRKFYATDADYYQFIKRVFTWARETDPAAKLFYNDYGMEYSATKKAKILTLINALRAERATINGVPNQTIIDGVGIQSHVNINSDMTNYQSALTDASITGLLVHISELDVWANTEDQGNATTFDTQFFTEDKKQKQSDVYRKIAAMYYSVPAAQRHGITMWDLGDKDSWVGLYTTDRPNSKYDPATMYDQNYNPKLAYFGLASGLASYTILPPRYFSMLNSGAVMYANGTSIGTNTYSGNNNQKWYLHHVGSGVYRFKNLANNGWITGTGTSTANGSALVTNTAEVASQEFTLGSLGLGVYSIKAKNTNQGFDRISTNGNMQFYNYGGGANQNIKLQIVQ